MTDAELLAEAVALLRGAMFDDHFLYAEQNRLLAFLAKYDAQVKAGDRAVALLKQSAEMKAAADAEALKTSAISQVLAFQRQLLAVEASGRRLDRAVDALKPPCSTCGGTRELDYGRDGYGPCPDCVCKTCGGTKRNPVTGVDWVGHCASDGPCPDCASFYRCERHRRSGSGSCPDCQPRGGR